MADQKPNALEMSDEDFLNAPLPEIEPETEAPVADAAADASAKADDAADVGKDGQDEGSDPAAAKADDADDDAAGTDAAEEGAEAEAKTKPEAKDDESAEKEPKKADKTPPAEGAKDKKDDKPADDKAVEKPAVVDFEAEYNRLLAPFKANGREIQVKSVDDAIALMQMGANYNKKMAGLKPNLKLLKLLENNGLLEEGKLNFLIDLDKKNPEAISKLIKDSGIEPMELDAEKAGKYQPKIQRVDDREVELDTVLDDIKDTTSYSRTLSIVSKEWDGASKQVIADSPQLLRVINDHVERGIYDLISKEVEVERAVGRLAGLSDIEAYRHIGDAINARGGFNHLGTPQGKPTAAAGEVVTPKPKKVDDDKLNEKRRAAAPTKPAAPTTVAKDFNPLALSDEDFAKMADPRFA